ncbi:MAG: flagellar associated protein [Monoraphidium minutum]|nr:MAG: flagellar associated protein [Monoraphidium minutum]
MPSKAPTLPAKGAGKAKKASATQDIPQFITLEDGSQVPIKIPPGMPAEQAAAVVEYLTSNPAAAKAAFEQAQRVMRASPAMAAAMMNQAPQAAPMGPDVFAALKDDPELSGVFEDVKANGAEALEKYWDDTDLMSKISSKLRAMQLGRQQLAGAAAGAAAEGAAAGAGGAPVKHAAAAPARTVETLHDAARWGDAAAAGKLIEAGADVNGRNDRGIPALGVAVGFNQRELVQLLLDSGADVGAADGRGSTALHYAAGYGRREVAELLLRAGADLKAANAAGQQPIDVAKLNGEKRMVEFLKEQGASLKAGK